MLCSDCINSYIVNDEVRCTLGKFTTHVLSCDYHKETEGNIIGTPCACEFCDNSYLAGNEVMCHINSKTATNPINCRYFSTLNIERAHIRYESIKAKYKKLHNRLNKDKTLYIFVEEDWIYIVDVATCICSCSINWQANNSKRINNILSLYDFDLDIIK